MPEGEVGERADVGPVGERGNFAVRFADHWLIYTIVISLAVAFWFNMFYFLFVWLGWTGAASFFR